nr:triose-phosphate isomerase [Mucilaginibacter paludis]
MRNKVIAANWNMNDSYLKGLALFSEMLKLVHEEVKGNREIIICPPFIHLHVFGQLSKNHSRISIGAQNAHQSDSDARFPRK